MFGIAARRAAIAVADGDFRIDVKSLRLMRSSFWLRRNDDVLRDGYGAWWGARRASRAERKDGNGARRKPAPVGRGTARFWSNYRRWLLGRLGFLLLLKAPLLIFSLDVAKPFSRSAFVFRLIPFVMVPMLVPTVTVVLVLVMAMLVVMTMRSMFLINGRIDCASTVSGIFRIGTVSAVSAMSALRTAAPLSRSIFLRFRR